MKPPLIRPTKEAVALATRLVPINANDVYDEFRLEVAYALDAFANEKTEAIAHKYHDLIYQVGSVFPGESRHDTAKRYIREREYRIEGPASALRPTTPNTL